MSQQDKKFDIPTVPLGENRTLFVPLNRPGELSDAIGFFVGEPQVFQGKTIGIQEVQEHLDDTVPMVAFKFKTKKSITDVIKFLRFYRDNLYRKVGDDQLEGEQNGTREER
jgi:hypothetical protein